MLRIHIPILILLILSLIFIFNKVYNNYFVELVNETENSCCTELDVLNFSRIQPPVNSFSYGWSQESKLRNYVDSACPMNGVFVCTKSLDIFSNFTHIQFLSDKGKIVYENTDESNVSIWVRCFNKKWLVEGQPFDVITCSQK